MAKEQRIIFVLRETLDGSLNIDLSFYPKLSNNKEDFENLDIKKQEMQNIAAQIGGHVMNKLAEIYKPKN